MNDKCAAGTGRFLEVIAETLGLKLDQLGDISLKAKQLCQDFQYLHRICRA